MKSRILILLLAITGFSSCEKTGINNNSILVHVVYNNEALPYADIYLDIDSLGSPLDHRKADAKGEAYFDELAPGRYYLKAEGNVTDNKQARGTAIVDIGRTGGFDHSDITIYTE